MSPMRIGFRAFSWLLVLGVSGAPGCRQAGEATRISAPPQTVVVWESGAGTYHTYRIPVVIAASDGTLVAFSEGRVGGQGDAGDIDLLARRSTDGGRTWSEDIVVCDNGKNTCGNPAPVVDEEAGVIHLLMTHNLGTDAERAIMEGTSEGIRGVYYAQSTDNGATWTRPVDISDQVREPDWRWYATGPVHGIQLKSGPHAGRLVIPANHSVPAEETGPHTYHSHVIYSDDHGATWNLGGTHDAYTNESTVVELTDGRLMQNMRSYRGLHQRAVATSTDGGLSWSAATDAEALIEPVCQASLLRYSGAGGAYPNGILLFSNPASTTRDHMTVRASFDDGQTWPVSRLIYEGSAAYSSLVRLSDGRIGLLYERDDYGQIVYSVVTLGWLLEGDRDDAP